MLIPFHWRTIHVQCVFFDLALGRSKVLEATNTPFKWNVTKSTHANSLPDAAHLSPQAGLTKWVHTKHRVTKVTSYFVLPHTFLKNMIYDLLVGIDIYQVHGNVRAGPVPKPVPLCPTGLHKKYTTSFLKVDNC